MWELDCEESWVPKNWCFRTVVWEKTLESPLDCKEIQPVHPKGDQSWVFTGRTDAEAETPILGQLMWRVDSLERTLMLGGVGGRRRRGRQRVRWLDDITDSMDMSLSELQELVMDREAIHGVAKSRTRLSNWTELNGEWCGAIFMCLLTICMSLRKYLFKSLAYFFNQVDFFGCLVVGVLYILWILSFYQTQDLQIFSPISWISLSLTWLYPNKAQNFYSDIIQSMFYFCCWAFDVVSKKSLPNPMSQSFLIRFLTKVL